jgi:hypothetical protein
VVCSTSKSDLKAQFQYGENRAKLVSLKEQKKSFEFLKPTSLAQFSHSVNEPLVAQQSVTKFVAMTFKN